MERKELIKIINNSFKELGYTKSKNETWCLQMQEIIIVFKIRTSSWSKHFYIDLGVVFRKLYKNKELKTITIGDSHIGHQLYNFFLVLGESQKHLEKLFSYDFTEPETLNNIQAIFSLFNRKGIAYFQKFNDYKYLAENFKEKIAFKPFFVYFELSEFYIDFFEKQLK